ncbi:DEAD/DEAH box helicase [Candidatus Berkelbacteria bacterium RIFCSPLOWO2_01_FULL_50_28]|uniref:Type I restriction enzyme endonuclease subunit n=1 Tax=Candidatus Berkelbacteria bacterium RIFCSPLOWO2_01_FULL_50_28 TaxID=1797471 RepID=A0A1F5EA75_9BACT|nr:MAG: DEAD/DEAH box helicase [Candidatus Berkelbacteria bacterium RIFCSPLOWO2_01_FULL_50_28]
MTEDKVEQEALKILTTLGWEVLNGPEIGPEGTGERKYDQVVLERRLSEAINRINSHLPISAVEEVVKKTVRHNHPEMLLDNHQFHSQLTDGVSVEYRTESGEVRTEQAQLFDFSNQANNEFVAVNQFTVINGDYHRRPDIVLFVNGLPLGIIEIKDPTSETASLKSAYNQLQTYEVEIQPLFRFNEIEIITDGIDAEMGTISATFERFTAWKSIEGEKDHKGVPMLEVLLKGVCDKGRFLEIIRNFIVFEKDKKEVFVKKLAAYHQYWAVQKSLASTVKSIRPGSDHRIGVVWHTQGSGKSLSMVFYAGKLVANPELKNPTVILVTDRNDLDNQLYDTFVNCSDILRQKPDQAKSCDHLKEILRRESGGIIFTTNAKFFPERGTEFPLLSDRENIIVIADEAHRSQYNFIDGFAKHIRDALPNASFIGFTGTPIEADDRSTPAVFGNYLDIYDIEQSVKDGATVPIYYESRLVELDIDKNMRQQIDQEFAELTEGEELGRQEELKAKWAHAEAIVGNSKRIERIASDIVTHFENRLSALEGKGMIVTMSRRIAVDLYEAIVALKPEWASAGDKDGFIKVIMTGSASDPLEWQQHIRNKERRREIADCFKDPTSPMKLVIVCDMWLTGFDAPSLHTMYLDKPLKGHNLMQAIARINRVYQDKPGGLVVDYLGVAAALREALQTYTVSGGKGRPTLDQQDAVAVMKEKIEQLRDMFHKFNYRRYFTADLRKQLQILLDAQEFVLLQEEGEKRFKQFVLELSKAFALAVPSIEALAIREEVAFFQAVRARLGKIMEKGKSDEDFGLAIKQIVDRAIAPAGVVDIFAAAGIDRPDISILSEEFLAEIRGMERKNLAVEALKRLLEGEVKARFSKNAIKMSAFSEMLEKAILRYRNNAIEAAQVIEELIQIARDMKASEDEAKSLGLSPDEIAFYDALVQNGSAKAVMGNEKLRQLARVLVARVRSNITVDWTIRANAQARLRVEVKRLLREYGYPPDQEKLATDLVLVQATLFGDDWSKE